MELVDMLGLEPSAERRGGSTPSIPTKYFFGVKYNYDHPLFLLSLILLVSCNSTNNNKSSLTGWNFNDPKYGSYIKGTSFKGQKVPDGMVE